MRLAADYQQMNSQKTTTTTRNITRLGKGVPPTQKRKRGISRSKENSRI